MVTEILAEFPGFGLRYDPGVAPFFKPILLDNLRMINRTATGARLLKLIADARPRQRSDFPPNVNIFVERQELTVVQSGHRTDFVDAGRIIVPTDDRRFAPPGCPFWKAGGSANQAVDQQAAGDGTGTVCIMKFTNVEVMTNKGEATQPFIVLAHELIHSWHCLYGTRIDGQDEELWTTGLGVYENHAWNPRPNVDISENVIRGEFGIKLRERYF
jgi:hypothetical protein